MAHYFVSSGMTSNNVTLYGDKMYVMSGGTANETIITDWGLLRVESGGAADCTSVGGRGSLSISSGGTANRTLVNSGGWVTVYSGGLINVTTIESGGGLFISSGATHNGTLTLASGGSAFAYAGSIIDFTVASWYAGYGYLINNLSRISGTPGYTITVSADQAYGTYKLAQGASAFAGTFSIGTDTVIYGSITVNGADLTYNGKIYSLDQVGGNLTLTIGSANLGSSVKIYSSGVLTSQANTISGAIIAGGNNSMHVFSGGTANSTILNYNGVLRVFSGGTANSTTVNSGGYLYVSSGGTANSTTVNSSGSLSVYSGGVANSTTVNSGGYLYVSSGGVANYTTVNSGGDLNVFSGGVANSTTVNYSGYLYVSSGGTANYTAVNSGGFLYIESGGTADKTFLNSSGNLQMESGGMVERTIINEGGFLYISSTCTANSTTVNYRGDLWISSGGTALNIVENGGHVAVEEGATVTFTPNTISGLVLNDWDSATLHSGTVANSTTVNEGGTLHIYGGGMANTAVCNGDITIAGGTGSDIAVNGALTVYSNGRISDVKVNAGGSLSLLHHNISATDIVLNDGAFLQLAVTSDNHIQGTSSGSAFHVSNGMLNEYNIINSSTAVYVSNGGQTSNAIINGGGIQVDFGGVVSQTTINSGILVIGLYGSARNTVVNGGNFHVYNRGSAANTTVHSGTFLTLGTATVIHTEIREGGQFFVNSFGSAAHTLLEGDMVVSSGASAIHTTVRDGGNMYVSAYGRTNNTIVESGGAWTLEGNATILGSNTLGGTVTLLGQVHTVDAVLNLSVAQRKVTDGYIINDLSNLTNSPEYAITVAADQAYGTYKLAQGAEGFTGTFSIGTETVNYGFITVNGEDLVYNGITYSLDQAEGNLTLTVNEEDLIPPATPIAIPSTREITNRDVTITVTYSDDSALRQYKIGSGPWMDYSTPFAVTDNTTVYLRARDAAGNESTSELVISNIDKIAPSLPTVSANITTLTDSNVLVSAAYSADSYRKEYSLNGTQWQNYTSAISMCSNGVIYFRGQDEAGNYSPIASYTVDNIVNNAYVKLYSSGVLTSASDIITGATLGYGRTNSMFVSSGGLASMTTINSRGALHVYRGGITSQTTVNQSGYLGIGGGATAYDTTIGYAGELTVWGGGVVSRNTIDTYGAIILSSGALAKDTVVNSLGGLHVYRGAVASNTTIKEGGILGAGYGATVYETKLDSFGKATLWGGAVANNTSIGYAAELTVLSGGLADTNTIDNWGAVILSSGAVGNSTTILANGGYHIYKGATAYTTKVTSGAQLGIGFGGTVYNLNIETGAKATFYDGSILRGWSDFAGTVTVNAGVDAAGSMINFDIRELIFDKFGLEFGDSTAEILVSNAAGITGASYFITLDADQAQGRYYLAGNAGNISEVTIVGTSTILEADGEDILYNNMLLSLGHTERGTLYLDLFYANSTALEDSWDDMALGSWDEIETGAAATLTAGAEEKKGDGFLAIA